MKTGLLLFLASLSIAQFVPYNTAVDWDLIEVGDVQWNVNNQYSGYINSGEGEASDVADIDKDGRMDIIGHYWWYKAPADPKNGTWLPQQYRNTSIGIAQFRSTEIVDLNEDTWMDIVNIGPRGVYQYINPGAVQNNSWAETMVSNSDMSHHQARLFDVNGDGKKEELVINGEPTRWYEKKNGSFVKHHLENANTGYGNGAGDINMDGKPDIIKPGAWFEATADITNDQSWIKHDAGFCDSRGYALTDVNSGAREHRVKSTRGVGIHSGGIFVYDVNGDGLNDVLCGAAHLRGLFWHEQYREGGEILFKQRQIDTTGEEYHTLFLADMDGDGDMDLVTGKRIESHGTVDMVGNINVAVGYKEPVLGGTDPNFVSWYELIRFGSVIHWSRHDLSTVDFNTSKANGAPGGGMDITVADVNKDGKPDVVTSGLHGGPYLFLQKEKVKLPNPLQNLPVAVGLNIKPDNWLAGETRNVTWISTGIVPAVNLAWGPSSEPLTPSQVLVSSGTGAQLLIDKNPNTAWEASSADQQWVEYQFSEPKSIGKMYVGADVYRTIETAEIQSFSNGQWVTVISVDKLSDGGEDYFFDGITTSRIRFFITKSRNNPVVNSDQLALNTLRFYEGYTIALGRQNNGSYPWTLPQNVTNNIELRIWPAPTVLSIIVDKKNLLTQLNKNVTNVKIYSLQGKQIGMGNRINGKIQWDGKDQGSQIEPGVYIFKAEIQNQIISQKVFLK